MNFIVFYPALVGKITKVTNVNFIPGKILCIYSFLLLHNMLRCMFVSIVPIMYTKVLKEGDKTAKTDQIQRSPCRGGLDGDGTLTLI